MVNKTQLKIGSSVVWNSQANGSTTTKAGVIVGFVPASSELRNSWFYNSEMIHLQNRSDRSRYIVKVQKHHAKTGALLKPRYYSPLSGAIESQN